MAEEQTHGSPLIDPQKINLAVPATPVDVEKTETKRSKPTAGELGPGQFCWGTGRRKSSIARVRIRYGEGKILINGREVNDYFPGPQDRRSVLAPLEATESTGKYDVYAKVQGGGLSGQSGAVLLGLARALVVADPDCFPKLRDTGYLTRNGRMKERKKYGQKAARKRFQFSKR